MNKKLFLKYIELFGDKPPYPPKHIMETLVKMKEDGSFDTKIKILDGITGQKVRKNLTKTSISEQKGVHSEPPPWPGP